MICAGLFVIGSKFIHPIDKQVHLLLEVSLYIQLTNVSEPDFHVSESGFHVSGPGFHILEPGFRFSEHIFEQKFL